MLLFEIVVINKLYFPFDSASLFFMLNNNGLFTLDENSFLLPIYQLQHLSQQGMTVRLITCTCKKG